MSRFPLAFPCLNLNAGGAGDTGRYALPGIITLAESLMRGVDPSAGPVAITERETTASDMLALFDDMLPSEAQNAKGKDVLVRINVPDLDNGSKIHTAPLQTVRDALASLSGESRPYAVVNGTRRTLALTLLWACGLTPPVLATVEVEGTDAELRDLSASGNEVNSYARAMSYQTRILYALSLYDTGVVGEAAMMTRAKVGRGIAQLMHSAAVAIRKHDIQPSEAGYPKLDKEGWRKVRDVEAGASIDDALTDNVKADARTLTIKRIIDAAGRCPQGIAGDVMRAIAADDVSTLARLLAIPV